MFESFSINNLKDNFKQELIDLMASYIQEISIARAELLEIKNVSENSSKD